MAPSKTTPPILLCAGLGFPILQAVWAKEGNSVENIRRSFIEKEVMAVDAKGNVEAAGSAAPVEAGSQRKRNRGGGEKKKKKKASGSGSSLAAQASSSDAQFDTLDTNGDGVLSLEEFKAANLEAKTKEARSVDTQEEQKPGAEALVQKEAAVGAGEIDPADSDYFPCWLGRWSTHKWSEQRKTPILRKGKNEVSEVAFIRCENWKFSTYDNSTIGLIEGLAPPNKSLSLQGFKYITRASNGTYAGITDEEKKCLDGSPVPYPTPNGRIASHGERGPVWAMPEKLCKKFEEHMKIRKDEITIKEEFAKSCEKFQLHMPKRNEKITTEEITTTKKEEDIAKFCQNITQDMAISIPEITTEKDNIEQFIKKKYQELVSAATSPARQS